MKHLEFVAATVLATALPAQDAKPAARPNVLFLAVDDLRPELGCYGASHVHTPHLDRLARTSVRFERAYCQQAICGPSRASIMTGLRPDTLGVHGNHTHFRDRWPAIHTLPQWFKQHGYHTQSLGKIYHGVFPKGASKTVADTFGDAPSWSVPTFRPGPRYYYTETGIRAARAVYQRLYSPKNPGPDDWTQKLVFGPATEAPDVADGVLYDGQVADRAVTTLRDLAKRRQPFFLAVGFIKPHSPYIAPKRYFDHYATEDIDLANPQRPSGVPKLALHGSGELRRYTDQPARGPIPAAAQRRVRHAYRACTTYIDAQIGKVLNELERLRLAENTIVVVWSDHGYHLGEAGLWGKTTNRELDTRVVLMVRKPGARGNGAASPALVELVDVYPTLVDLAGLPSPKRLEGTSMAPLLDQPTRPWKRAAFSQYTRGKRRGYSIRTARYRYTEWFSTEDWRLLARELYDHATDPHELHNIASTAAEETVRHLAAMLQRGEGWREAAPDTRPLVSLATPFTDHMVLQRDQPVRFFGRARPGTDIRVSFGGQERRVATVNRRWSVTFPARPASQQGLRLGVHAQNGTKETRLELQDLVLGDVWLCAGQSNMRWRVSQSAEKDAVLAESKAHGVRLLDYEGRLYPHAKEYGLDFLRSLTPANYYTTKGWRRADRTSVATFSAVGFAFGRRIHAATGVPVGLIHNAIGGVPIETYLPPPADPAKRSWLDDPNYPEWCQQRARKNLTRWRQNPRGPRPHHPFAPAFLWSAGIAPLAQLPIRGVIWYQGESNATGPDQATNAKHMAALVAGFRKNWRNPKLPFYFVQLPGLNRNWAPYREVQALAARTIPHVGMATTIDVGHPTDVHPRRKVPVGERLARLALVKTYGRQIVPTGPTYRSHSVSSGRVHIQWDHAAGLRTRDDRAPLGFMIAGKDRTFYPATATIQGTSVVVASPRVPTPAAVRYAFADDPTTNLINGAALPAAPFRTDDWPLPAQTARAKPTAGPGSFEQLPVGPLRRAETPLGRFVAAPGHVEITSRFARSGKKCLRMLGGKDRTVVFFPKEQAAFTLTFWAERWTKREPFAFEVAGFANGTWRTLFDGNKTVRVGRAFLTRVQIDVPAHISRLRLRSTAPQDTGVLLDDFSVAKAAPMRVVAVTGLPWTAPALHGKRDNPITRLLVKTEGSLTPKTLRSIRVTLDTKLADIAKVRLFASGGPDPDRLTAFGAAMPPARILQFQGKHPLQSGENYFWISVELAPGADLDARVAASFTRVDLEGEKGFPVTDRGQPQRVGVAVRTAGQDRCHTFRIPGLATTNAGTLLAVYDCRYRGSGDLPGDVDVGLLRSTDGGRTWEPQRVIMDMGRDPKWRFDGIGDPAILVDRKTGTAWVAATWSHGNRSWRGSGPGLEPQETGQFMLVRSDDDGKTWSKPINITKQIKNPEWRFVLQGPGKGITMRDGTLVFPAQFRSANGNPHNGKPFSTLIYSKDRGQTWKIGTGVKVDTTEAQLVELGDGRIMINCRDNRGGSRSIYTTKDLGATWQEHATSRSALPEPVCMASLIRLEHAQHGPLLVFSNPARTRGRRDMTLKVSRDEGASWPVRHHLLYDQRAGYGYSCLTRVGEAHVGTLYEGRRELYFLRVPLRDLLK